MREPIIDSKYIWSLGVDRNTQFYCPVCKKEVTKDDVFVDLGQRHVLISFTEGWTHRYVHEECEKKIPHTIY